MNFKIRHFAYGAVALLFGSVAASATLVLNMEFNDTNGTTLQNCVDSVSSTSPWVSGGATATVATTGGLLEVKTTASASNLFRNATGPGYTTGIYDMTFMLTALDFSGGDASGCNVGWGFRDAGGTDLMQIRFQENTSVRLQAGGVDIYDFGTNTGITNVMVRTRVDLDADTYSVYLTYAGYNGGVEGQVLTNSAISTAGLSWGLTRFISNANSTDMGASDYARFDYLKVDSVSVPEPSTYAIGLGTLILIFAFVRRRLS